jgi:chemotaxis protein MotB
MKAKNYLIAGLTLLVLGTSCVSQKKFKSQTADFNKKYGQKESELKVCETDKTALQKQTEELLKQIDALNFKIDGLTKEQSYLKENNTVFLNQLESLSVISNSQAESIKKSMESLGIKDAYIQGLQRSLAQKDSLNMALVMNLKGVLGNLEDEDINIKVDKGVVFIDISDKLLFKSGSFNVTDKAKVVLEKVATVLKNQPNLEFMVEGHTDNVPYPKKGELLDNWDLSVKRATSIVRLLQNEYGLEPQKMIAAGRSEYQPLTANDSNEAKAANRRTRIVILPQFDQFFKLLERN